MANKTIHGVVRTDRMFGTDVAANLVSVMYMGAGTTATAIDNGNVVKLSGLMDGEREIFKGVTPAANTAKDLVALIATPEVMYDERKKNLNEFENEAGAVCRAYLLHTNDIFSVTKEALDATGTIAKGWKVEMMAGTKLKAVASVTSSSTAIGEIIAIEKTGNQTYYVIQVA